MLLETGETISTQSSWPNSHQSFAKKWRMRASLCLGAWIEQQLSQRQGRKAVEIKSRHIRHVGIWYKDLVIVLILVIRWKAFDRLFTSLHNKKLLCSCELDKYFVIQKTERTFIINRKDVFVLGCRDLYRPQEANVSIDRGDSPVIRGCSVDRLLSANRAM